MYKLLVFCFLLMIHSSFFAQQVVVRTAATIDIDKVAPGHIQYAWLELLADGSTQPITVPVMIARGAQEGPTLGLTAAIHGNELNGIKVIQEVFERLDVSRLRGNIIAIPGINPVSMDLHQRRYPDDEDLNRLFPGKPNGSESQQYAWQIRQKILPHFNFLIDLHTASFGRINSLYVRADMQDSLLASLAKVQDADIILHNEGQPSAGASAATRTMRAEAIHIGIPTLTIEYGDPQVYQPDMIQRGVRGIENTLVALGMTDQPLQPVPQATVCRKSYWLYVDKGGLWKYP
ncbi:MAG: succinylglutamate desuccinylase/aspartoacylase family protein [Saprospiraceae bacterium]